MLIDLHIHTTASDGTWDPEVLIEKIIENKISIFSVTDHDSVDNVPKTIELAKENNLLCIPGVEISSTFQGRNCHMLAYRMNISDTRLKLLLKHNRAEMERKDKISIKILEKKFESVSYSEYLKYDNNFYRGGWKSLNYIIDKGLCSDYIEFFGLFGPEASPLDSLTFPDVSHIIKTIHDAGGYCILAHPGSKLYDNDYKALVSHMVDHGIDGIECHHIENSDEITQYCIRICRKHGLMITGGSDCHGTFAKTRRLGDPRTSHDLLEINPLINHE